MTHKLGVKQSLHSFHMLLLERTKLERRGTKKPFKEQISRTSHNSKVMAQRLNGWLAN